MSILRALMVFLLLFSTAWGQLKGIAVADMDTGVLACDDFYNYANGKWRAQNPIPASMSRWSRRWQAGEMAKDRLRQILEDVAIKVPKDDYAAGSVDRLVSDFYATCKDEELADKTGITPISPLLAKIDSAKNKADIERMIGELALL